MKPQTIAMKNPIFYKNGASLLVLLLSLSFCLLQLAGRVNGQQQPSRNNQENRPTGNQQVNLSGASAGASANALSSVLGEPANSEVEPPKRRPGSQLDAVEPDEDPAELPRPPPRGRLPPRRKLPTTIKPARRPPKAPQESPADGYEDECDDDEDEYQDRNGNGRKSMYMMANPMRQFSRMWDRVLRQMQPEEDGDYADGGSALSVSSFSDGRTTRMASAATDRDGRTRGIFSETRDGRTKTRRFGDSEETDDNDDQDY